MAGIIERRKNLHYKVKHQHNPAKQKSLSIYCIYFSISSFFFFKPVPLGLQDRFSDALRKNLYLYVQRKKETRCMSVVSFKISSSKKEKLDYKI